MDSYEMTRKPTRGDIDMSTLRTKCKVATFRARTCGGE